MLRATTPTLNPTRSGTPTFGVGMDIPSPSDDEDHPVGGSAATGSDPRVPTDIVVENGDVDGGSSSKSGGSSSKSGGSSSKSGSAKVVKAKRVQHANSQAQNPMQKWAGLMRHIFLVHIVTVVTEKVNVIDDEAEQVEEEEKEVKKINTREVSTSEMWKIIKFVSIKDASWWIRHNADGALYDATKSSAVYGLPYGAAKALIPALRMVVCNLMGGEIKEIEVTKEDGTKDITFQGVVPRTTESFADVYKDRVYKEYYDMFVTLLDAGFVVDPPMSIPEVYALDGNFQALKSQANLGSDVGKLATKQLGLLADYLVSLVGEITVERPENKGIMTFTEAYQKYDDCTDVFSVVMFAARQIRKTMGIQEDNCAMDIDENSQPMDGDTYLPTPSKNKKSKKNIVDGEAMPALVFDADGNPMPVEKPTPWHLKDKKFIKAFKEWSNGKEIWDIVAAVHQNGRKMNKDHLTEDQKKAYAKYRAEVDRARNAAKAAEIKAAVDKGKADAKLVEELQAKIQTLEEQAGQVMAGAAVVGAPRIGDAAVMAWLRIKLQDAKDDLAEANDALGGTRLTLEMAERKYDDYVVEKTEDVQELTRSLEYAQACAWETQVKLDAALEQIETLRRNAAMNKERDPAVTLLNPNIPSDNEEGEGSKKRKAPEEAAPTRSSGRSKKAKK